MYLGVDVGGTKTLVAVFDENGSLREETKFPTPQDYDDFVIAPRACVEGFKHTDFKAAGIGLPGRLNREHGKVIRLGNLPWQNEPIQADCEKIIGCPVVIENDANLAGLSEAMLHKEYDKVLYVTISTGIGTGIIHKHQLVKAMLDTEGGQILLPFKDKLVIWEKFASGKAIYEHFGKKAMDITDAADWKYIVRNLGLGLYENMAIVQPDLIIIGGSVGVYFDRYAKLLEEELERYKLPVLHMPTIKQAQRPEEAVIYGCYDLAKQTYGH